MSNDDLVFQISDWNHYHELGSDSENNDISLFTMRLYGTTNDGKKIFIRVDGFTPYFYVEIPKSWRKRTVQMFMDEIIKRVPEESRKELKSWDVVDRHKFWEFTNYKMFNFVRLVFHSHDGFRAYNKVFYRKIYNRLLSKRARKYNVFESNIEPMLRFMHIRKLQATGWTKIPKNKYKKFRDAEVPSDNEVNIYTKWTNLFPVEEKSITPFVIASFDIECTSGDGTFPQPHRDADKIIQIGTTFNRYGTSDCFYKHIITLGSCDPIAGVDVESYDTEKEVLLAWSAMIKKMNPDVLTGYNIFGFDYRYIEARSKKLGCYNRFSKLGRIKNEKSPFILKELSSSALGDNKLYYYAMQGRVQVDLFKVIQSGQYSLSSYKLDNVASSFIREKMQSFEIDKENGTTLIHTASTYGLASGRFIKVEYNDGYSNNSYKDKEKFEILEVTSKSFMIKGILDSEELIPDKFKVFWCQAKDDVKPHEIFALQHGSSADRAKIARYCIQDCLLVNKLMEKLQVLTNTIGMSNVCSVPLQYIFLRGQGVKIFSLVAKKCRQRNHLIPVIRRPWKKDISKMTPLERKLMGETEDEEELEGFEGATVLRPDKGVHFAPIAVLDYSSLYPKSMIHRNISHECIVNNEDYDNLPGYDYYDVTFYNKDGSSTTSKYAKKQDGTMGIIPEILQDLLSARASTRELIKTETDPFKCEVLDGLQLAYKITANSLYGQTGARTSPIYMRELAASTTATGRELLNAARIFSEYIFPKVVLPILDNDFKTFKKRINLMFDNKLDEIMGPAIIKKLKATHYKDNEDPKDMTHLTRPSDYYYIRVFSEKKKPITDDDFKDAKKGITNKKEYIKHFYKEFQELMKGVTMKPHCVYGDTDSVFVNFGVKDLETQKELTDHHALVVAIQIGIMCGDLINFILPHPQNLEYEKTFWPWISLSKKRYVGNLYTFDPNKFYQKSMGIVLKRRDNAPIVKIVVGGIVDKILNERSAMKAVDFTRETLKKILSGKFPLEKFIITKTLRAEYADRTRVAHASLADRMAARDPGNKPQSNDRIPYAYIETKGKVEVQGDRIEHPDFIIKNKLRLDYLFYITNQIMKPSIQFLEKMIKSPEKIFKDYIVRETNRRKGKKPISYYFEQMGENTIDDVNLDDVNLDDVNSDDSPSEEYHGFRFMDEKDDDDSAIIVKPRAKAKSKAKKSGKKPKFNSSRGGFTIDI